MGLVLNTRLNEYFVGGEVKEFLSKGKFELLAKSVKRQAISLSCC